MSEFTFNPRGSEALFNPSAAFGFERPFLNPIPSIQGGKVKDAKSTGFTTKLPPYPVTGLDTVTGKRIDLKNPYPQPYTSDFGSGLSALDPEWRQRVTAEVELANALQPLYLERAKAGAQMQAELSNEQIRALYPLMSRAQQESIAANLLASKDFRRFKETMPSSVQDIMASKQNQMTQAASAEGERQRATAAQQQAANEFPGKFIGQYVQIG